MNVNFDFNDFYFYFLVLIFAIWLCTGNLRKVPGNPFSMISINIKVRFCFFDKVINPAYV